MSDLRDCVARMLDSSAPIGIWAEQLERAATRDDIELRKLRAKLALLVADMESRRNEDTNVTAHVYLPKWLSVVDSVRGAL